MLRRGGSARGASSRSAARLQAGGERCLERETTRVDLESEGAEACHRLPDHDGIAREPPAGLRHHERVEQPFAETVARDGVVAVEPERGIRQWGPGGG